MTEEYEVNGSVCSYHVLYTKRIGTTILGEKLLCERKQGNPKDHYVVAVKKWQYQ